MRCNLEKSKRPVNMLDHQRGRPRAFAPIVPTEFAALLSSRFTPQLQPVPPAGLKSYELRKAFGFVGFQY